jgi:hypothetical protein
MAQDMMDEVTARWCKSCGAPIPKGATTCEVCGMPVEGAFEDSKKPVLTVLDVASAKGTGGVEGYISAVPLAHEKVGEKVRRENTGRHRVLALSLTAAFVLVAGTTIFITRPWDPNAYAIHSFEDADTSMEGYPGYVRHLSSQDKAEESLQEAYIANLSLVLDGFSETMDSTFQEADDVIGRLDAFFSGETVDTNRLAEECFGLRKGFDAEVDAVASSDFNGTGLEGRRDFLLMLAGYLDGELSRLVDATTCVKREEDRAMGVQLGRAALVGEGGGYTMQEYRELYTNAVATYGT